MHLEQHILSLKQELAAAKKEGERKLEASAERKNIAQQHLIDQIKELSENLGAQQSLVTQCKNVSLSARFCNLHL